MIDSRRVATTNRLGLFARFLKLCLLRRELLSLSLPLSLSAFSFFRFLERLASGPPRHALPPPSLYPTRFFRCTFFSSIEDGIATPRSAVIGYRSKVILSRALAGRKRAKGKNFLFFFVGNFFFSLSLS